MRRVLCQPSCTAAGRHLSPSGQHATNDLSKPAAYAVGYTGLGVAATRFGARVAPDLVDGARTRRTQLSLVRSKATPFPPEPLRWAGIQVTRRALARSDRRQGRRGAWLGMLDRPGVGFDS